MPSRKIIASGLATLGLFTIFTIGATSAQTSNTPPPTTSDTDSGPDPALINLAPVDITTPDQSTPDQQPGQPQTQPDAPPQTATNDITTGDGSDDQADQPPPPLVDYDQPFSPGALYFWCPGYWANNANGFFWVPGQWVLAPYYGALWTPPYWSYSGTHFLFHRGYWADHVGFYGGVNYGFGYVGTGYFGAYWRGHDLYYNSTVTSVDATVVHNIYAHSVVYKGIAYGAHSNRFTSYNGGHGGLKAYATIAEQIVAYGPRLNPTTIQEARSRAASRNPAALYSQNQGHPAQPAVLHRAPMMLRTGNIPTDGTASTPILHRVPPCDDCLRLPETVQQAQQKDQLRRTAIQAHHEEITQRIAEQTASRRAEMDQRIKEQQSAPAAASPSVTSTSSEHSSSIRYSPPALSTERRPTQPQPIESRPTESRPTESRINHPETPQPAEPEHRPAPPTETATPAHEPTEPRPEPKPEPRPEPSNPHPPAPHPAVPHPVPRPVPSHP